jgi:hypothetical protein
MTAARVAVRYRDYAAQCVSLAQCLDNANERLVLLHMAQVWLELAEKAERNGTPDAAHTDESEPRRQSI